MAEALLQEALEWRADIIARGAVNRETSIWLYTLSEKEIMRSYLLCVEAKRLWDLEPRQISGELLKEQ